MKLYHHYLIIAGLAATLSCSGNKEKTQPATEAAPAAQTPTIAARGEKEFRLYCLTCHQEDGNGVRAQFPPLAGNDFVTGPTDTLIRIVLVGLQGPVTVKGQQYNQVMPAQDYLSDQQVADVLTYIRNSWGNSAPSVEAEDVKKIRSASVRSSL